FLITYFYFLLSFLISNLYLRYVIEVDVYLIEQLVYFNRYFFIFILYFALYKVLNSRQHLSAIAKVFRKLFVFNGLLAIAGLLLGITLFESIPDGVPRFGYSGLILAQNEASIFYL